MNKIKGDNYEAYILNYLIAELKYDNAWLWKNVPERILFDELIITDYNDYLDKKNDIGIDILALKENQYTYIQCKNYEGSICVQDLAGYFFFRVLYPNKKCQVFYNGNLSSRIKKFAVQDEYINVPYITDNNYMVNTNKKNIDLVPRNYQLDIVKQYNNSKRFIISLPCGMGKTYTSFLIAKSFDNIIFFAPTRELCIQTLDYFSALLVDYKCYLVSSDGERNPNKINLSKKNLLVSTFDSCDVINILVKKLKDPFIIIDEFHNLSKNDIYNKKYPFYDLLHSNFKILFLSATPKYLDNKEVFGNKIYKYDWNKAIENKYINDFEIILPSDSYTNINLNDFISLFNIDNKNIDQSEYEHIIKMYFIIRNLLFNGNIKCIIYLLDTNVASKCATIIQWMSLLFKRQMITNIIDYRTDKNSRKIILDNFANNSEINILLNVHVLDEGIDVPACDSVFITNPSYNIQNIVQRMSRCNRRYVGKERSYIYLWTDKEKTKEILDYINNNTNNEFNYKYNTMDLKSNQLIRSNDILNQNNEINNSIETSKSKYYCDICNYRTDNRVCWYKHKRTNKHIVLKSSPNNKMLSNNSSNQKGTKYFCGYCDYYTDHKVYWFKHKKTLRHIQLKDKKDNNILVNNNSNQLLKYKLDLIENIINTKNISSFERNLS